MHHRVAAIVTACFSTVALALSTLSGISCSFVEIAAKPGMLLLSVDDFQMTVQSANIGILCENGFYQRDGDQMWELSRIFFIVSVVLGSISTSLSWAVSTFLAPTLANWKLLSLISSLTAVLQVPTFLVLEAEPCSNFLGRQECILAMGSYFMMASTVFWVAVVFLTQCMDPPMWAIELSAWRVQKRGSSRPAVVAERERESPRSQLDRQPTREERIARLKTSIPDVSTSKSKTTSTSERGEWKRWFFLGPRDTLDVMEVRLVKTQSTKEEEDLDNGGHRNPDDYGSNVESTLRILTNGKRRGEDAHSTPSFEDLDAIVEMAEEGRSPELKERPSSPKKKGALAHICRPRNAQEQLTCVGKVSQERTQGITTPRKSEKRRPLESTPPPRRAMYPNETTTADTNIFVHREETNQAAPIDSASPEAILRDLEVVNSDGPGSPELQTQRLRSGRQTSPVHASPNMAHLEKDNNQNNTNSELEGNVAFKDGVRELSKRAKRDARKKKRGTRRKAKNGYSLIDDDDADDEDDNDHDPDYSSPPKAVNITRMGEFEKMGESVAFTSLDKTLMEEWNALHAATRAGAQVALLEESHEQSFPFDGEEKKESPLMEEHLILPLEANEYEGTMDGYSLNHSDISFSDPEPMYYDSDDTKSEMSLSSTERFDPETFHDEEDEEESGGSGASSPLKGSQPFRKRKSGSRRSRRRGHRSTSSLASASMRSTVSLMDMTIDEETVQDVLEEDEDADLGLGPYNLIRTKSAPEPRGKGISMLRPLRLSRSSLTDGLSLDGSSRASKKHAKKQSSPSPSGTDPTTAMDGIWKEERSFGGGIHARGAVLSDDSSSDSNQSFKSNKSHLARRARIQRLRGLCKTEITIAKTPLSLACDDDAQSHVSVFSSAYDKLVRDTIQGENQSVNDTKSSSSKLSSEQQLKLEIPMTAAGETRHAMKVSPEDDLPSLESQSDGYIPESVHLQLIANRRPEGAEYGADEASL
jgi:hypothetical protein